MLALSSKWIEKLAVQPETGMGYHVVSVILQDGQRFDNVVVNQGYITQIRHMKSIPFREEDIGDIIVTHNKWDFSKD